MNEILLIISLIVYFSAFVLSYKYFGLVGIIAWNTMALIIANIEVLIIVNAFGITQTLGNVAFTSTSLVSDLVSEKYGKEMSKRIAYFGFLTTGLFVLITQTWLHFISSDTNDMSNHINTLFKASPRIIIASLCVYVFSQLFDIKLFFKIWEFTKKLNANPNKYLMLRSTGSTLLSQLFNAILFNVIAFTNVLPVSILVEVIISTFAISCIASLIGTPWLYWATKTKTYSFFNK